MTVLELLEEMDDILDSASQVPLTGKVMVDKDELSSIIEDIRRCLPDDVRQAKWLKDEKERILDDAKAEYKKLIMEAKKQADYLVDTNDVTLKARKHAEAIDQAADNYSRQMKIRTYDYLDKILYDMQGTMASMNDRYINEMYSMMADTFEKIQNELDENRAELKKMAERTKNGEDWMYEQQPDQQDTEESGS